MICMVCIILAGLICGAVAKDTKAHVKRNPRGAWDHDLSQRQMLNQLSHPGAPILAIIFMYY